MPLDLVDTHCHIQLSPLAESAASVLSRAAAAGVRHCLIVGTTVEDSRLALQLARTHAGLRAAVGIHPHDADAVADAAVALIDEMAVDAQVAAIGEVGLDDYRCRSSPERQARLLEQLLEVAQHRQLPVVLHCRDAYERLISLLRRTSGGALRGVIHCASGPPDFIQAALALGLHISFAGNVTFPSASALRSLVPLVPEDRILLETDAPFLAPQPVRGATNEPAYITHTAVEVARIRGTSPEVLAALASRNARALFGFPGTGI